MVLIECYTPRHIENISTCLRLDAQKLIIIGEKTDLDAVVPRYKEVLAKKKPSMEIDTCDVTGFDFGDTCARFRELLAPEGDYVLELSGGDALTVMAMGAAVVELTPEKRQYIQVLKYDHKREQLQDCIHDCREIPGTPAQLSVWEMIRLQGGEIYPRSQQPEESFTTKQLEPLWDIVVKNPEKWNKAQGYLAQLRSLAEKGLSREEKEKLQRISLPVFRLYREVPKFSRSKEKAIREVLSDMDRRGVVVDRSSGSVLDFTFTDPTYKYCAEKAGNVLEVKVLLEARELKVDGKAYFNDCRMSVNIDWDGKIGVQKENGKPAPETRNEIDGVLMCGLTPLFISCKNGTVEDQEIYKLSVVTRRYGGPHARPVLMVSDPKNVGPGLVQRAKDMGVELVPNAAALTKEQWQALFTGADKEEQ